MASDQDFFFDEEEPKKPGKTSGTAADKGTDAKRGGAASASKASAVSVSTSGPEPFLERTVTMVVALLLMAITLLVGVIIGFAAAGGGSSAPIPAPTGATAPAPTGVAAPQLTEQQLNQGLPSNHPSIGASGSKSATKASGK